METAQDKNPQVFLNEVADAMDAAANQLDSAADGNGHANGRLLPISGASEVWRPKFAQKLVYSSCYTLSFGICFPVFLACRYIPKNNSLVQGIIEGGSAASRDVDAWLARSAAAKQHAATDIEEDVVADTGAGALAPA